MTRIVQIPSLKFDVRLSKGSDGGYTVECPSLPGCISQGKSRREALANIREAIQLWLEAEQQVRKRGWKPVWERGSP